MLFRVKRRVPRKTLFSNFSISKLSPNESIISCHEIFCEASHYLEDFFIDTHAFLEIVFHYHLKFELFVPHIEVVDIYTSKTWKTPLSK